MIMHFNVRSLQKNVDHLSQYLLKLKVRPQIIAVTETKLIKDQCHINVNLPGYNFIHCDTSTRAGGVGFYIEDGLQYIPKNVSLN